MDFESMQFRFGGSLTMQAVKVIGMFYIPSSLWKWMGKAVFNTLPVYILTEKNNC